VHCIYPDKLAVALVSIMTLGVESEEECRKAKPPQTQWMLLFSIFPCELPIHPHVMNKTQGSLGSGRVPPRVIKLS